MARLHEPRTNTVEQLFSLLGNCPDPVWLLGAGASLKSGIPLSEGLVARAAKWEYCKERGSSPDDPRIKRSDFLAWLKGKPWYREGSLTDNYHAVIRHLLQPRENRREFFLNLLDTRLPASSGYHRMADFMFRRTIRTVLTTNFDSVLPDHCRMARRPHHVELIQTPSDYTKLRTDPRHPQYVYLHGSVEHYTDQNDRDEVQTLDPALVDRLLPLLRDHPLIVVGYRGGEPSIMQHLLADQAERVEFFRLGVYWCAVGYEDSTSLHPLARRFAQVIGTNFQVVPIVGFDELLDRCWALSNDHVPQVASTTVLPVATAPGTLDMHGVEGAAIADLDISAVRARLTNYCAALDIPVPQQISEDWLIELLVSLDLAIKEPGGMIHPTIGGYLLFGKKPQQTMPNAVVRFRALGEDREVTGNLWNQLDTLSDALAEFNRPFRLKGEVSESVYPYPPLALKEIVVNALVHRDYAIETPITFELEHDRIVIANPGGLVPEVLTHTPGTSLQEWIAAGHRGVKGYRNPVIADLFYGAGAMDKQGSGLADVHKWVNENGATVQFGSKSENTGFQVTVLSRPEAVDRITGTAAPVVLSTRYAGNMLEVLSLPEEVWEAKTTSNSVRSIWEAAGERWLPPFVLHGSRAYSLHRFRTMSGQDAVNIGAREFQARPDRERVYVWLLNEYLYRHLQYRGLVVDKKRKRAYFPRTETGERPIPYQARLRRATRVVTKPIVSSSTQKIRYWEHKAFSFSFDRFHDAWALQILPGYVFTTEGKYDLLRGERVTALATRRASRDYNSHVHHDLVFWAWVLSGGDAGPFNLEDGRRGADIVKRTSADQWRGHGNVAKSKGRRRNPPDTLLVDDEVEQPAIVLAPGLSTVIVNAQAPEPDPDDFSGEDTAEQFPDIEEEITQLLDDRREEADDAA